MRHIASLLRNNPTDAERRLWHYLRNKQLSGFKFRRQEVLGDYIVDFVCLEAKLIIEVDGGQHLEQADDDLNRTRYLNTLGYKVVRYWNNQVLTQIDDVIADIITHLSITPP